MTTDQSQRSYIILARAQAALGLVIALVIGTLYGINHHLPGTASVSLGLAILGLVGAVYYVSLHQLLRKRYLAASTLVLTLITGLNLIFIIAGTGGLDSPYYAFWLLAIIVAGFFGSRDTIIVLVLTAAYYLYTLFQHHFGGHYAAQHLPQLGLSILAGGISEWVYWRTRRTGAGQTAKVATLTGQLTEEQLKAQVLMNSITEGVVVVDADRRIQLFNPAAQTLTGWDAESAKNIDYNSVLNLHTADDQALSDAIDPLSKTHQADHTTTDKLVMTTRAGVKVPVYLSVSPILNNQNGFSGSIILVRDITQEKEVERQRDEFVSTASHEMRTPVAAIEGYISLAMNPNVATIDDRAKGYLEKAHTSIGHLGELFRDLLSVTKVEEGKLLGPLVPVNLTELLKSVVDDMQFTAQKKRLEVVFQASPEAHNVNPIFWVMANPERLSEVTMNLIDNALKFTQRGGITINMEGTAKEVTVSVADTGVGIPAGDLSHLFQKFYRVDNSATRTIGGTGLGLYLARQLIELFNGRIWVESIFGKGSTFKYTLPRITAEQAEQAKKAATNQILPQTEAAPPAIVMPQELIASPAPVLTPLPTTAGTDPKS